MKSVPLFLLLGLVVASPALSQPPSFKLEQVMSSPFPSELVTAAHAQRIAWVFDARGERNVWVADAPGFRARQVTHFRGDDGQGIHSVQLTPDGKTLIYSLGSELGSGGHSANPAGEIPAPTQQVWATDVDTGETRPLGDMGCIEEDCEEIQVSPDGKSVVWSAAHDLRLAPVQGIGFVRRLAELRGDEIQPQWAPDSKHLAFVTDRHNHSFVAIFDFVHASVRYLSPSADRDSDPRWSPDGKQIIFIRTAGAENHLPLIPLRPHPWAIWIADPVTGVARPIWQSGEQMNDSLPLFASQSLRFAAGGRIVFCSEQDGHNHLYSISSKGGSPVLLTQGDFDVEDVALTPDKTAILFTSNQADVDRRHVWRVSVDGTGKGQDQTATGRPSPMSQGKTIEWSPVMLADGRTVVCLGSSATSPAMPYRLTDKGREMIAAESLPASFPSAQLVEPQPVIFHSTDGLEIHGQLFLPRNLNQSVAAPAIIFLHGGPERQMMLGFHYMQYYHNSYAENEYLASLGYVVLAINYRLGIMYGSAFRRAPNSAWRGAAEYQDVVAGARYLRTLHYVDAKRIGIWGGSYGGLLTAQALARNSDIFAAGVDYHGIHDWSVLKTFQESAAAAPDFHEAVKLAFDSSPVAQMSRWKSPVLLVQGDDDRTVPFDQTVDLVQRLKEQHVDFEELILPDETHLFLLWRSWVRAYTVTADFFNRKLKNPE